MEYGVEIIVDGFSDCIDCLVSIELDWVVVSLVFVVDIVGMSFD